MAISGQEPIRIGQPNESANSDSLFQAFNTIQNNFTTVFNTASNISTVSAGNGVQVTAVGNGITITNTGVTKLVAGDNVTITNLSGASGSNGALVISSTGTGGNGGGTVTSIGIASNTLNVTNTPVIGAGNININLPTLANVSGSYRNPNITVDQTGRVIAIANGSVAGTVTSVAVQVGNGLSVSGSPITSSGTINITNTGVTSIVAGPGIAVNQSNGAVTITNTGGGGGNGSGGTVTRVGVVSNTLSVTGSPIITSGNINIELPQNLVVNNIQSNTANISTIESNFISVTRSNAQPGIELTTFSNNNTSSRFIGKKSRGTANVPLPIITGDFLTGIQTSGYTTFNTYQLGSGIDFKIDNLPSNSTSYIPSRVSIFSIGESNIRNDLTLLSNGNLFIPGSSIATVYSNQPQTSTQVIGKSRGDRNNISPVQVGDSIFRNSSFGYTGNGTVTISDVSGYSFSSATYSVVTNLPSSPGQQIPSDYYITTVSNSNVSLNAVFSHTGNFTIPESFNGNGISVTANVNAVNGLFSNSISASVVSGILTTGFQPNVTQVGTLLSLNVSGNVNASNFTGNLVGNVSGNIQVPGINGGLIYNNNGLADSSSNFIVDTSINVMSINGDITANNITASLFTGTLVTGSQPNITQVGTLSSLDVSGNITANNITANLFTGTLITGSQPNITQIGTLSSLGVSGNLSAGNITGVNSILANFYTGTLVTGIQPNITQVGTLSSLGVSGNITVNNILANGNVIANVISLTGDAEANSTASVTATYPIVIDGITYKLMLTQ